MKHYTVTRDINCGDSDEMVMWEHGEWLWCDEGHWKKYPNPFIRCTRISIDTYEALFGEAPKEGEKTVIDVTFKHE